MVTFLYYSVHDLGYFSTHSFFFAQVIRYVPLCDFQVLFYTVAVFVEVNEFHWELAVIL